uniref:Small integral membrane protein 12 n=1 Tax=Ditylenchus dipsaci TaxID=166011 RepID=A0A915ENU2_9BILA
MWNALLQRIGGQYAVYLTFPFAFIVGSIGYFVEKSYSKPRAEIPYLQKGLNEQRMNRQIKEEFRQAGLQRAETDAMTKIVPQTLSVNTGRSSS